jgi:hypothetical protein
LAANAITGTICAGSSFSAYGARKRLNDFSPSGVIAAAVGPYERKEIRESDIEGARRNGSADRATVRHWSDINVQADSFGNALILRVKDFRTVVDRDRTDRHFRTRLRTRNACRGNCKTSR